MLPSPYPCSTSPTPAPSPIFPSPYVPQSRCSPDGWWVGGGGGGGVGVGVNVGVGWGDFEIAGGHLCAHKQTPTSDGINFYDESCLMFGAHANTHTHAHMHRVTMDFNKNSTSQFETQIYRPSTAQEIIDGLEGAIDLILNIAAHVKRYQGPISI